MGRPAIRLGLAGMRTLGDEVAEKIVDVRARLAATQSLDQLTRAVTLTAAQAEALATAGALDGVERRPPERALGGRGGGGAAVRHAGRARPSDSRRRRCRG